MDSISLSGTFPDGTWSLSAGPTPLVDGFASMTGGATFGSACGGTCPSVFGTTAYTFAGNNADGIVFSYQGNTSGGEAAWSGVGVVTP